MPDPIYDESGSVTAEASVHAKHAAGPYKNLQAADHGDIVHVPEPDLAWYLATAPQHVLDFFFGRSKPRTGLCTDESWD